MPETENVTKELSRSTLILGFLCFNGLHCVAVGVSLALLLGTYFYPKLVGVFILVPYYTYVLVLGREEMKDGAHWLAFSKNFPLMHVMRQFLSIKLFAGPKELAEADKKGRSQFLLAVFPHGTNADFRILMDGILDSVLPTSAARTRTLAATVLFRIPIVREFALWTGCVDARRSVADKLLANGRSILVVPGGQAEQIRTVCGKEIVYLSQRKGFLKIAMKHSTPVVPVYAFGVSDYYQTSSALLKARLWLVKALGISIPLAWGFYGSPMCPRPIPTTIVFGKPMYFSVKHEGCPTQEELDTAHSQFCEALSDLFDEHKERLGYGDRSLEII